MNKNPDSRMKILALETVDISASVALMENMEIIGTKFLSPRQRSAQFLNVAVTELLKEAGWRPTEVELVALPVGPGSFTGLRVGVTFAKTFSYITGAAAVGLNTLDILAANAPAEFRKISVALDAQRGEVIVRDYEETSSDAALFHHMKPLGEMRLLNFETWTKTLEPGMAVTGPILARKGGFLPADVPRVPEEFWQISPILVGKMAWERFSSGQADSIWEMLPIYSRPSAAEERLMEARKKPI